MREGVQRNFLDKDERVVISKVANQDISKNWMAYRVEMQNSSYRKWTNMMCNIVKQFNDKKFATQHPKGTTGSLYKLLETQAYIDSSIGDLLQEK